MKRPDLSRLPMGGIARALLALAIGATGSFLFVALRLPLPWMLGALTACFFAAILKLPINRPRKIIRPMRMVLGVAVGAAFSPELVGRAGGMVVSLAILVPFMLLIGFLGILYFRRLVGFDRPTAFFAAMPGGFNDMLAMGRDAGADLRKLSLAHATRVLIIVFAVPFWLQWSQGLVIGGRPVSATHIFDLGLTDVVVLLGCGLLGWWGAKRLGISGAAIVGPMIMSAVLHAAGLVEAKVPRELINLAQIVLGTHVGCQFLGITMREFVTTVAAGIAYTAGLLALTALFTTLVVEVTGLPIPPVLLAYAPGGQAEMNLMAVVLGTDVAYVALHHLLRLAIVIVGSQFLFKRWFGRSPPPAPQDDD